jgi:hypothetical protein
LGQFKSKKGWETIISSYGVEQSFSLYMRESSMNTLLENNPNQMRVKLPNSSSGEEMITRLSISCSTPWNPKPNNSLCSMTLSRNYGKQ